VGLNEDNDRDHQAGEVEGSNQTAPVPRDKGRIQDTCQAEGEVGDMRQGPSRQAVQTVLKTMASRCELAGADLAREVCEQPGLPCNEGRHCEDAFERQLRAILDTKCPEAFSDSGGGKRSVGSLEGAQGDKVDDDCKRCKDEGRSCDEMAEPGSSTVCASSAPSNEIDGFVHVVDGRAEVGSRHREYRMKQKIYGSANSFLPMQQNHWCWKRARCMVWRINDHLASRV